MAKQKKSKDEKKKKQNQEEMPNEEMEMEEDEEMEDDEAPEDEAIGLKEADAPDTDAQWEQVSTVIATAEQAYKDGTPFPDVLNTLIETLVVMRDESTGGGELGGLGMGGPEMNLPAEPADGQV